MNPSRQKRFDDLFNDLAGRAMARPECFGIIERTNKQKELAEAIASSDEKFKELERQRKDLEKASKDFSATLADWQKKGAAVAQQRSVWLSSGCPTSKPVAVMKPIKYRAGGAFVSFGSAGIA